MMFSNLQAIATIILAFSRVNTANALFDSYFQRSLRGPGNGAGNTLQKLQGQDQSQGAFAGNPAGQPQGPPSDEDRPRQGGGSGPGIDGAIFEYQSCDASDACDLPRGEGVGFFFCRYHPIEGVDITVCVPPERAIAGDDCGCCNPDNCQPPACTEECEIVGNGPNGEAQRSQMGVEVMLLENGAETEMACVPAHSAMNMVQLERARCIEN